MLEQVELLGGEPDGRLAPADLVGADVHQDVGVAERASRPRAAAAEQRPDPGQQLLVGEGLDQVVVGAAVEPAHPVGGGVARGQHQDRQVAFRPQPPADLQAVDPGEHHVQDRQVGHPLAGPGEGDRAVGSDLDLVALVDQGAPKRGGDLGVVVDHQDVGLVAHALI